MAKKLADIHNRTLFLGVGAQKAGTTWLYYYLAKHPDVFVLPIKEMHFFGNRGAGKGWPIKRFRRLLKERRLKDGPNGDKHFSALRERIEMGGDVGAYKDFIRKRIHHQQLFGEITPAYSMLDIAELHFIRSEFPRIKIIYIMRNPVDRFWSHLRFSPAKAASDSLESQINMALQQPVYMERGEYSKTIQNLQSVFSSNELHFEFYENLFADPAIQRLCGFLEIPYLPGNFTQRRNVSAKARLEPRFRTQIATALKEQYDFVFSEFTDQVPQIWRDDYI